MTTGRANIAPFGLAVAVTLLLGVSLVQGLPRLPPEWLSLCLLVPGLALALRPTAPWRLAGVFVLGLAWAMWQGQSAMVLRLPETWSRHEFEVGGRVIGLPQHDQDSLRFDFRVESSDRDFLAGKTLRLGWYGDTRRLEAGSRWRLRVRLKRPHGVTNPGGFDAEQQALEQRLAATGYVREPQEARRLQPGQGLDRLRERLSDAIAGTLPGGRGRFVQALALGDTRGLDDRDWEILRATGLTHLIAISGFHVGLVAGFGVLMLRLIYWLWPTLGRRWPRQQTATVAAVLFAAGYTALAGFALPTLRTLLMIAVVMLARLLRRAQGGADAFALALIAVLVFDPLSVLAPGFWLSFVGVAWLLWCLPHERDAGVLKPFLESQAVAVLGLLPLTVWFFGQASLPGPLTNLVGIPWISLVVVPLALLGLAAFPVSPTLAAWLWQASAWLMDLLWRGLEWVAQSPLAMFWLPEPSLLALLLALCACFWLLLPRGVPGKPLACLLLLPLLWPAPQYPATGVADITVIDVGQGLSVLVRTRNHALLFDAGPASDRGLDLGEAAVVPALHALGVRQLDALWISHGDNDHSGGADAVHRAYPASLTYAPEGWAKPGMFLCRREQRWRWDGVDFRILHPPPDYPYLRNDSSCVLRVQTARGVALIPGDIGRQVETRLLREQSAAIRADLLLVPHHGSETSSSPAFIAAVHPRYAVISSGADNRFRLPRASVLDRYDAAGVPVLNTALAGALHFRLDGDGLALVERRRLDRPRYWRDAGGTGSGYAIETP